MYDYGNKLCFITIFYHIKYVIQADVIQLIRIIFYILHVLGSVALFTNMD